MSNIDLREIDIHFRWNKSTPGVINYRGFAFGYVPDDTQENGERRLHANLSGSLTPTQYTNLSSAATKNVAIAALEDEGTGPHVVTDDTDT